MAWPKWFAAVGAVSIYSYIAFTPQTQSVIACKGTYKFAFDGNQLTSDKALLGIKIVYGEGFYPFFQNESYADFELVSDQSNIHPTWYNRKPLQAGWGDILWVGNEEPNKSDEVFLAGIGFIANYATLISVSRSSMNKSKSTISFDGACDEPKRS